MWLNDKRVIDSAISVYKKSLLDSCPHHVVIEGLFDESKINNVIKILQNSHSWQTQKHTYSALYVDNTEWQKASQDQRFVQRDVWQRTIQSPESVESNDDPTSNFKPCIAQEFLSYLRSDEFMSVLSRIFDVAITDINVENPDINTNYFRLGADDFIEQHADDSPGREVCMLLYLNDDWKANAGGEIVFMGSGDDPISIAPLLNRCILFDPSSKGSEHWVNRLDSEYSEGYRYNVTSWYWSE